jgi:hypothetical protein
MNEVDRNTKFKENVNKSNKVKKTTQRDTKDRNGEHNKFQSKLDEQQIPTKQTEFEKDDDFWNFYEQPFVQS